MDGLLQAAAAVYVIGMKSKFTAVIKQDSGWWIG